MCSQAYLFTTKIIPIVRIVTTPNKMSITGTNTPIKMLLLLLILLLSLLLPVLSPWIRSGSGSESEISGSEISGSGISGTVSRSGSGISRSEIIGSGGGISGSISWICSYIHILCCNFYSCKMFLPTTEKQLGCNIPTHWAPPSGA